MIYTNTTSVGIYIPVPGEGHKYCAPGAITKLSISVNVPGLEPTIIRPKRTQKKKPVLEVITKKATADENDVRTSN